MPDKNPTQPASQKKADVDNRANQLNSNNDAYHRSRGQEPPPRSDKKN
jgi:hypothetical protein